MNKEEITFLEEALVYCEDITPRIDGDVFQSILQAAQYYLELITGKHETLVVVPREPTKEMITSGGIYGRFAYSDIYKSMIQAAQEVNNG